MKHIAFQVWDQYRIFHADISSAIEVHNYIKSVLPVVIGVSADVMKDQLSNFHRYGSPYQWTSNNLEGHGCEIVEGLWHTYLWHCSPDDKHLQVSYALQAIFREAAIKTLSERLTSSIAIANEQTARETDQLFNDQAELGNRGRAIEQGLNQAQVRLNWIEYNRIDLHWIGLNCIKLNRIKNIRAGQIVSSTHWMCSQAGEVHQSILQCLIDKTDLACHPA